MNLDVKKLDFTRVYIRCHELKDLCEGLKTNKTVTCLNLKQNDINANQAKDISDMLSVNNTIYVINLAGNCILMDGMKYISTAFFVNMNMTLRTLDLRGNSIRKEGAKYIGDILSVNKTLVYINIQNNSIGDEGVKYISDGLSINDTLYRINMRRNDIYHQGAIHIANAIIANKRLAILEMSNNYYISITGIKCIKDAIAINKTLIRVDLYSDNVQLDFAFSILTSLIRNEKHRFDKIKQNAIALKCLVNFQRRFRERQYVPPNGMYVRKWAVEHDADQQTMFKKFKK